jgi:ComF family protein
MPAPETCGRCLRMPPAFDAAIAAFEYRFPLDRLVQRFKFAGDLAAGRWLGEQLARATGGGESPDVLVAPPLSRARLRTRGFNQAIELARVVAATHGLRVDAFAVDRVRDTSAQPGLGRRERRENLRGAFHVSRAWPAAHVAIVDDVMTTGATAEAMARAFKDAGARRVSVWVVARTPEPGR